MPGSEPHHDREVTVLADRTVVVIGASAGIGLDTARQVRAAGGRVFLVGRNAERLESAARELDPVGTAAFDATDTDRLQRFFQEPPGPVDHVLVTAGGPYYMPLENMDLADARRAFDERLAMTLGVALYSRAKVRAGGTLLFIGGTGGRRPGVGMAVASAVTAALPALVANLALELAPIRVNLIAAGFVDTPLSAALLGDQLDARREELRATLPIRRLVGPADVAALAVHIMCNDALTGGTYDIDGGQQLARVDLCRSGIEECPYELFTEAAIGSGDESDRLLDLHGSTSPAPGGVAVDGNPHDHRSSTEPLMAAAAAPDRAEAAVRRVARDVSARSTGRRTGGERCGRRAVCRAGGPHASPRRPGSTGR